MPEPVPSPAECPPRPADETKKSLGFEPRKGMVRWLSPKELAATAGRVLLSSVFGAYADKREIQAALPCPDPVSYADGDELWVDFVADLGDAFGPTYAVASLLARPELALGVEGGVRRPTQRGRLLVMGGDEVYPTPSIQDYRDHTLGPYRAALPCAPKDSAPHLYAIPGNHDWYDGLTGFMRVFCRQQWIGGWKTQQSRSYFAVQLRDDWWLWGIDIQFDTYVDEPQFRYFAEVAEQHLKPGDSVILCSAAPTWVDANQGGHPEAFATLDYFERKLIRDNEAKVRLALSGDAHHYARYVSDDGAQRITAGGGGAFLAATHNLPEALVLPPDESEEVGKTTPAGRFELKVEYPSKKDSRKLRWRIVALPYQNWSMAALIGGVHLVLAWMIQAVLRSGFSSPSSAGKAAEAPDFSTVMPVASVKDVARAGLRSPLAMLLGALVTWGMSGFTKSKEPAKRVAGAVHGVLHLAAAVVSISVASDTLHRHKLRHGRFLAGFVALVGVGGGLLGSWLLAGYLFLADRYLRCNTNELFAAQRNRDYKNFLRIHFGPDGGVTVYPVKVARTPRKWKLRPDGAPGDPWFDPDDVRGLTAELIEEPIRLVAIQAPATSEGPATPASEL